MITASNIHKTTNAGATEQAVITVSHLKKQFDTHVVLNDFSLVLHKGESLVVLGRSGSGKSVLIKCIIGLMLPDSGAIDVLGNDVLSLSKDGMDHLRARVGFLFQSNALYDSMSVRENLEFPMRRHKRGLQSDEINEKVMEALTNVGLAHTVDMMPAELSGGMQKRVALARTLIMRPEIMLYDEPTTGLDPITGGEISNLIVEIQKKYNTSSITISHDMKCVETIADRILVLIDGKCYAEGTYVSLQQSTDKKIKQFFE
jgi:phospholipid/cholesterol/gamma-HCH transport system ATP-binding protein